MRIVVHAQDPPVRYWRAVALALKAALAGLLLFALVHPDWERFADKAMGARAIAYPLAALIVPAVWAASRRLRKTTYPWDIDALLVAPFAIDVAGNTADLFDTIGWFDDACHFGNWALLSAAAGAALRRGPTVPPWMLALSCAGIGAIAAILWELAEFGVFIQDTPETLGIYRDTIGDQSLGLAGATLAGILTAIHTKHQHPTRPPDLGVGSAHGCLHHGCSGLDAGYKASWRMTSSRRMRASSVTSPLNPVRRLTSLRTASKIASERITSESDLGDVAAFAFQRSSSNRRLSASFDK